MSSTEHSDNLALETAVEKSDVDEVRGLLENGANPHHKPGSHQSLMDLALEKQQTKIILLLLKYSATVEDNLINSMFDFESFEHSKELVTEVIRLNNNIEIIYRIFKNLAFSKCKEPLASEILELLFEHGLPIDDPIDEINYVTPLNYAVFGNRIDWVWNQIFSSI